MAHEIFRKQRFAASERGTKFTNIWLNSREDLNLVRNFYFVTELLRFTWAHILHWYLYRGRSEKYTECYAPLPHLIIYF
jgi:hypothetical protein